MEYALGIYFHGPSSSEDRSRELFNVREIVRSQGYTIEAECVSATFCFAIQSDKNLEPRALARDFRALFKNAGIVCDPLVIPLTTARTKKRLAVFDMDSTLIRAEVIDEYARELGRYEEVSKITASAMRGEIDFNESFTRRMMLLKGLTEAQAHGIWNRIQITEGTELLFMELERQGVKTALLTGGFRHIALKLQDKLGLDHILANEMIFENGVFNGQVTAPIINADAKATELRRLRDQYGFPKESVLAIGDGANDIPMLLEAGFGIAFQAKAKVIDAVGNAYSGRSLEPLTRTLNFPL